MAKLYYIKERYNPQFEKQYYACCGQLTKQEAKRKENSLYRENIMLAFKTEKEYNDKIAELESNGYIVCPFVKLGE